MKFYSFPQLVKTAILHGKVVSMKRKGIKTNRHIIVLESDDWGSIRIPNYLTIERLAAKRIKLCSPYSYDRFDTLASEIDLTSLMEVLNSVCDSNGRPAVITLNTIVANPDFDKIQQSDYRQYFYEPFTETLKRYPHHANSFKYWKEGIEKGLFKPQFHGREHLNSVQWMRSLQAGNQETLMAFSERCFSHLSNNCRFLDAYNAEFDIDYLGQEKAIREGLELFEKIFGYRSNTMIAPCYMWDLQTEKYAWENGVSILQGSPIQKCSNLFSQKYGSKKIGHYMGEKNELGQLYTIRNCRFEPSDNPRFNGDFCLYEIKKQFQLKHPAIITCHRQNFIGELVPENRNKNLKDFKRLLQTIVKLWPDVEFMSSDELGSYLRTIIIK